MARLPDPELVRFVRETLGCGCPEELVERTALDRSEAGEPGLDVGGRLLVRVLIGDDVEGLVRNLPGAVLRLRDERDRRGFNRVRVVVAHDRLGDVAAALDRVVAALGPGDDRLHLHLLSPADLPAALLEDIETPGTREPAI
ncbi:MAG TPA: hypothetical protein VLB51_15270 [Methylomirabilota bacterium]|nr:hypothetical protein [Methylomirabilota bacterium]